MFNIGFFKAEEEIQYTITVHMDQGRQEREIHGWSRLERMQKSKTEDTQQGDLMWKY